MLEAENPTHFRHYAHEINENSSAIDRRVFNTYKQMHTHQCVDFVRQQYKRWLNFRS